MSTIRTSFLLLARNFFPLIIFEAIYKLLCIAVFAPVFTGLFNLSLYLSGFRYLSEGRLRLYLSHPTTIIILFLLLICLTLVATFEMNAVIFCFHGSYFKQKVSVTALFRYALESVKNLSLRFSPLFIVFVMLIIPLTNLTVVSGYFTTYKIPDFIMYAIRSHKILLSLFIVFVFFMFLLSIRWCYSIHSFVLDGCSYPQARKKSCHLIRHHYLKTLGLIFCFNVIVFILLLLFCILWCAAVVFVRKLFLPGEFLFTTVLSVLASTIPIVFSAYSILSVPVSFAFLSARYYQECNRLCIPLPQFMLPDPMFRKKTSSILLFLSVVVAGSVNLFYFGHISNINFTGKQNIILTPSLTAHRGDSIHAPENTLAAFESAIEIGADCIELDVAQTKDGVIVVTHDSNLKRVTGKNINIWDITYEELKELDAGSWFRRTFAGEPIPTLYETLEFCKGKIQLNIELKPTGHEREYEASILSVIEELNFEKDCVIASKSADSLKKIKEMNPNISTVYLMTVAYGNLAEMDFADGFSIESSFVSASMVSHVHDAGKSIYAWTVNDESGMERMLRLGVDSLVTDDIIKARETFYSQNLNETIVSRLRNMFPSMP